MPLVKTPFSRILLLILLGALLFGTGCKNKKKLAEEKARQEALAKDKARNELVNELEWLMDSPARNLDDLEWRIKEKDRLLAESEMRDDPQVEEVLAELEAFFKSERERLEREKAQAEEIDEQVDVKAQLKGSLDQLMDGIAHAASYDEANAKIAETLDYFESEDVLVLRVIFQNGDQKDYDRPISILKHLNYLKDQKRNPYKVESFQTNADGKVTSLELKKIN